MEPGYFAREATPGEIGAYIRGLERRQRAGWEQARLIAFSCLRPWVKDIELNEVAHFYWEEDDDEAPAMSEEEEKEELRKMREELPKWTELIQNSNGRRHCSEATSK